MQNVRANVKVMEFQSLCIFSCILTLLIILIKPPTTKAHNRRASGDWHLWLCCQQSTTYRSICTSSVCLSVRLSGFAFSGTEVWVFWGSSVRLCFCWCHMCSTEHCGHMTIISIFCDKGFLVWSIECCCHREWTTLANCVSVHAISVAVWELSWSQFFAYKYKFCPNQVLTVR